MSEQQSTIKYKQRLPFTQISNDFLCSNKISGLAKALWCVLYSRPENWVFYWSEILKNFKEGKKALASAKSELEKSGYLISKQKKVLTGRGKEWVWGGMDISLFYDPSASQENQGSSPNTLCGDAGDGKAGSEQSGNGDTEKDELEENKDLNNTNSTNKDLKPPLPPTEEKSGVLKFEGGVYRLEGMLSAKAFEQAKNNRHGWDWWYLCNTYIDSINSGKLKGGMPKDINKAFPAWILSYNKGKPPG